MNNVAPDYATFFTAVFSSLLTYGVRVKTVCASCNEVYIQSRSLYGYTPRSNAEYDKYCGDDVYGYDNTQSGLVMVPLVEDENGNLVEKQGTLPAFIHSRTTKVNRYDVPSQMWSTTSDGHRSVEMLTCFLATATKGTVSFAPDFMGYGLSDASKSYLIRNSYVTSFLPLWIKVAGELTEDTDCKTALADAAFIQGYSEGGYASIAIGEALNKVFNVEIVRIRSGAPTLSLEKSIMSSTSLFKDGLLKDYYYTALLFAAAYSSTNTNLANYGAGQDIVNTKYTNITDPVLNILSWLEESDITANLVNERMLNLASDEGINDNDIISEIIFDPEIVSFMDDAYNDGVSNPCSPSYSGYQVGINDLICEALVDNSLTDVLYSAQYPVQICHSVEDELVTYDNIPDITRNPEYLTIAAQTGDHFTAGGTCITSDIVYFTSAEFRDYTPLVKHKADGCGITNNNCADSPFRFKVIKTGTTNKITRDCEWAATRSTNLRCSYEGVAETCPLTCGKCQTCIDSTSRIRFMYNGRFITRDCGWVRNKNTLGRCRVAGMEHSCRKTCNQCV